MEISDLVRSIHARKESKGVIYLAGGGGSVLGMLGNHGGCSNTLLAARVPYAQEDFTDVLGYRPEKFVGEIAARNLASAAFAHACKIRGEILADNVFGIGSTAKLSTGKNEREGRVHEIHIAVMTSSYTEYAYATFEGNLDRSFEEYINAKLILNFIALGKGIHQNIELQGYCGADFTFVNWTGNGSNRQGLQFAPTLTKQMTHQWVDVEKIEHNAKWWIDHERSQVNPLIEDFAIFSGSWNPLHDGHRKIKETAESFLGKKVVYELSLANADKPPLDHIAIFERLLPFEVEKVLVTNAPTFLEKARIFPKKTFVVGYDTMLRIVNPKYYGSSEWNLNAMLDELQHHQANFLVFGRADENGSFRNIFAETLSRRAYDFIKTNATIVPESDFRVDVSSSQIRKERGAM